MAPIARKDPAYKKFGHFNLVRNTFSPSANIKDVSLDADEFKLLHCDIVSHTEQKWLDGHLDYEAIQNSAIVENNFYSLRNLVRQLYSLNQVTDILLHANEHFGLSDLLTS